MRLMVVLFGSAVHCVTTPLVENFTMTAADESADGKVNRTVPFAFVDDMSHTVTDVNGDLYVKATKTFPDASVMAEVHFADMASMVVHRIGTPAGLYLMMTAASTVVTGNWNLSSPAMSDPEIVLTEAPDAEL
jgi:hypothetical protein